MRNRVTISILIGISLLIIAPPVYSANPSESAVYEIEKSYQIVNNSPKKIDDVVLTFYAFDNFEGWSEQHVLAENIATNFPKQTSSTVDNRVVKAEVGNIEPHSSKTVNAYYRIKVDTVRMDLGPGKAQGDIPPKYLEYTEPVAHLWQSENPEIRNKAQELTEGLTDYYSKVKSIMKYVENHLTYSAQSVEHSALWAYNNSIGDCTEYTNLFIALCRAVGIPTKTVSGYLPFAELYGQNTNELQKVGHQFTIVYMPSTGWAPLDLTYLTDGEPTFGRLTNNHLVELTSDGSNWVNDSIISVPGARITYVYRGESPDVQIKTFGTVTREIAVKTEILSPIGDYPEKLSISIKVSNVGLKKVDNLEVRINADNTYFESPPAEKVQELNPGTHQILHLDLNKKRAGENKLVGIISNYETGEYGEFRSVKEIEISIDAPPKSTETLRKLKEILEEHIYEIIAIIVILLAILTGGIVSVSRR